MSSDAPITVIEPPRGWRPIALGELVEARDLFRFLVWRQIRVRYAQTVLGLGWVVLQPVVTMIIFTVVFGRLAKVPHDGIPYPIFCYAALVPWNYFANSFSASISSLLTNAHLLSKVYFPRLVLPLAPVVANLLDFAISFVILGLLMIYYRVTPTPAVAALPLLILLMMMTATGIGLWLAALAVQYRDIKYASRYLAQMLMYAAPVVWPASQVPEAWRLWYGLYPMAGVIEGFRSALIGKNPMPWDLVGMGAVTAVVLVVTGAIYFRQTERGIADVR
jgi:lipopolysaccharide transport system permease protein